MTQMHSGGARAAATTEVELPGKLADAASDSSGYMVAVG